MTRLTETEERELERLLPNYAVVMGIEQRLNELSKPQHEEREERSERDGTRRP